MSHPDCRRAGTGGGSDHLDDHCPEEYRESMLKNVRLNREIMEAWAEHGAEAEQRE